MTWITGLLLFIRLNSLGIFLEIMKKKSDSEINRITKQKGNKIIIDFFYILVFLLVKVKTQMCLAYSRI